MNTPEQQRLIEKLRRIESLFADRATTPGEKAAAGEARERTRRRLAAPRPSPRTPSLAHFDLVETTAPPHTPPTNSSLPVGSPGAAGRSAALLTPANPSPRRTPAWALAGLGGGLTISTISRLQRLRGRSLDEAWPAFGRGTAGYWPEVPGRRGWGPDAANHRRPITEDAFNQLAPYWVSAEAG